MRSLNKLVWAALIAGATSTPGFAQISTGGGGAAGGSSGGAAGGSAGGSASGAALQTLGATPQISAPTGSGGNTGSSLSTSNFFSQYYANPYYQGILTNAVSGTNTPGGFGTPLFTGTSASGGGAIGSAAGTTTAGGATTGARTTGAGAGRGTTNNSTSGILIPLQAQMSYRCKADFDVAPVIPAQLQNEIVGMLGRSKDISDPASIQVSTNADIVTIRGVAKSRDEARMIESMVRMTAGVHGVKNEIAYPPKQ